MLHWLFGKREKIDFGLEHIGIDIHSHIIPGVDDGVESLEESINMIRKLVAMGYKKLITTPHVMWDCYRNTPEIILAGLREVQDAIAKTNLAIEVDAAAEYFIDEHFMEMLSLNQQILTLPGNRVLVELPYSTPLLNTFESLFFIIEKGFQPVLAHPERYTYYYSDLNVYKKLADQGCELQLNALSLSGYYGPGIQKTANWLLENKLVTFLGTDAHKTQHIDLIKKSNYKNWLIKYPFQNEKLTGL